MTRRAYIFEQDPFTAVAIRLLLQTVGFRVVDARNTLPEPTVLRLPDADILILDPRIVPSDDPTTVVLSVWKLFEGKIEILIHHDDWAFQHYRQPFKELGIRDGFTRESWTQMKRLVTKYL
jgi:hypothetical protein